MTLKLFIVEDEAFVRDELRFLLGHYEQLEIAGEADNSFDAICGIHNTHPDVVFLDIKIDDIDGITLAKKISEKYSDIRIVFVTAFDEYALDGFEVNAVDYVLKPFSEARLAKTVDRLLQDAPASHPHAMPGIAKSGDKIIMKKNNVWKLVDTSEILYFQSQDHTTLAVTTSDTYTLNYTLRELETQLLPGRFLRTHKSFIVNLGSIHEIIPWFNYTFKITLKDRADEIPVSRSYLKKFKSTLKIA